MKTIEPARHAVCITMTGLRHGRHAIQHGKHSTWQVCGNDPANLNNLDEAQFSAYGTHRVVGYEVPLHEIYADGFMFVREVKDRWGGIVCYDLRKPAP